MLPAPDAGAPFHPTADVGRSGDAGPFACFRLAPRRGASGPLDGGTESDRETRSARIKPGLRRRTQEGGQTEQADGQGAAFAPASLGPGGGGGRVAWEVCWGQGGSSARRSSVTAPSIASFRSLRPAWKMHPLSGHPRLLLTVVADFPRSGESLRQPGCGRRFRLPDGIVDLLARFGQASLGQLE